MVDLTVGKLPKAVAATIIGDSLISEAAGAISVASLLHVYGDVTLHGATSGTLALRAPTAAGTSVITFPVGTTNFTATGGTGRVLRQSTVGGAITVGTIATTDVTGLAPIATSGSATDLTAGIVPSARVSGAYTGITSVGTLTAGIWNASTIGLAYGGTQANLSATGGTGQVLRQSTAGGAITVAAIASSDVTGLAPIASSGSASDLSTGTVPSARIAGAYTDITSVGTLTAGVWNGTAVGLAYGGTGANLSATGGTGRVLKQLTAGGAITVAALTPTDVGVAGAYLPLSGGSLSGTLTLTAATTPLDIVVNGGTSAIKFHNALSGAGATAVPTLELIGVRGDGNSTFQSRLGLGFRRSDGTPLDNGFFGLLGTLGFGGQWGTDNTTYQSAKFLYAASISGIAEGAFTAAAAMPTAIVFGTGIAGVALTTVNQLIGTERMRITSTGLLTFAGTTASFPALKRSTTELQVRLADDSGYASIAAATSAPGTNTNQLASTAFVTSAVGAYLPLVGGTLTGGLGFGAVLGASAVDLSKHISLHTAGYGLNMTSGRLNLVAGSGGAQFFVVNGVDVANINSAGLSLNGVIVASSVTSPTATAHIWSTGNFASGLTTTQTALLVNPTFVPSGASLSQIVGAQIVPALSSTALALSATYGVYADFTFGAGYTGTVTNAYGVAVADLSGNTPAQVSNTIQFYAYLLTNGNGLTTGSVINYQFLTNGIAAGAAGGTLHNRGIQVIMPSGGASAGTAHNRGIYITGNGGTASGSGTVNNFALFSDSTAPMQIGGTFQFLGSTASFPMLKRSGTSIQVRLADDSGFGALDTTTLTGVTTLPGSGQITAAGLLGVGTAPATQFHVGGTSTTAADGVVLVNPTFSSSYTGQQIAVNITPVISPTGASVGAISGLYVAPSLNNNALAVGNYAGVSSAPNLGATYSGVLTALAMFSAASPTISGGSVNNVFQYSAPALAVNNGATTGTKSQVQIYAQGITSTSAGATLNNRGIQVNIPSGGASAGTAVNRGIYITGNGGTATGGTVENYAIFSDSTAPIQIGGTFQFLGSTASFPMLKRSATIIQVRLADDTNFAPIQGQLRTHTNYTAGAPPAATGYLTLYDAAGTAYRVACVV